MLDKETLKQKIQAAFDAESDREVEPATARENIAEAIAGAVYDFVAGADVTVNPGIAVATAGTAAAQTGQTTGTGTGTIS